MDSNLHLVKFEIYFQNKPLFITSFKRPILDLLSGRLSKKPLFWCLSFQTSSKYSKSHSNCNSESSRERDRSPVGSSSSPYSRHSNFSPRSHRSKSYSRSRESGKRGRYFHSDQFCHESLKMWSCLSIKQLGIGCNLEKKIRESSIQCCLYL